jgi:hypothetical protein
MSANRNACSSERRIGILLVAVFLFISSIHLSSISVAAESSQRVPRPTDVIPRPTDFVMGLAQIQYRGYFADDTNWFSDARFNSSMMSSTVTPPSGTPVFNGSSDLGGRTSFSWTGYFIPDVTGEWQFRIASDDASYMWLGNDAIVNYQSAPQNALIRNGGIHAEFSVTAKVNLVKDKIYPLRIQYGNDTNAAVFKFNYTAPGTSTWQEDFTTLLWRTSGVTKGDCTNFGLSYRLVAEIGYDRVGLPIGCKVNGVDPPYSVSWVVTKPEFRVPRDLNEIPRPQGALTGLHQGRFLGYLAETPEVFKNKAATSVAVRNILPSFNNENFGVVETYMWSGYFVPDVTGDWQFKITSDDASYMWFGNEAIQNWMDDKSSARISVPAGAPTQRSVTIKVKKDDVYPIRILYGNSGGPGTFNFEILPPGIGKFQTNTTGLFFHTSISYCTNWGISYLLMPKYGYDQVVPNSNCKEYKPQQVMVKSKPETPRINVLKMTSAGLTIEASIGDVDVSNIYLLSPTIGYSSVTKLAGKISGKVATFLIPISKLQNVKTIDVNIVSSNNEGTASTSKKAVPVVPPNTSSAPSAKPAPKKTVPAPKTIRCEKGDKSRVFAGTSCPPGWSK